MSRAVAAPGIDSLVLVKLGGSLITDKRQEGVARGEIIERLAREVSQALPGLREGGTGLVLGHGSGSFGHVAARRLGYDPTAVGWRHGGAGAIQAEAARLHALVAEALIGAGVEIFSLVPSSFMVARDGAPVRSWLEPLRLALEQGRVPLLRGDVVLDETVGYSIVSTERVLLEVAGGLRGSGYHIERALWLGETDGVWNAEGSTLPALSVEQCRSFAADRAAGTDVTGGMRHRLDAVAELAEAGVESRILDGRRAGGLVRALLGESVGGTTIRPEGGN
jgi:isopentenyl phosphate kinase